MDTRKIILFLMTAVIALTLLLVLITLSSIKASFVHSLSDSLKVVRDTTHESVNLWASENEEHIVILSTNPHVISLTEALLHIDPVAENLINAPAQKAIRELLQPNLSMHKMHGFFIIGPDNISIASTRDSNLGMTNLLVDQPEFLKRLWGGEILMTLPQPSDVPLPDEHGEMTSNYPTMFVGGPIRNKNNNIIALFTLRLDPVKKLKKIVSRSTIGTTGETYLINRSGVMITESRFSSEHWLNIEVPNDVDTPEKSMLSARQLNNASSNRLTKMAESVVAGNSSFDTDGYLDYRGVKVVGAWLWDSQYDYGLVTEIDMDEAFLSYNQTKRSFMFFSGATTFALIFIALVFYRLISRLKYQEKKYQSLFENAGDPILISDHKTGCILSSNSYACQFLQYHPDELIGKHLSMIRSKSDRESVINDIEEVNRFGSKLIETTYKSKQGDVLNVEISAKLVFFGNRKVIFSIIRDITPRKQVEMKLLKIVNTDRLTGLGNQVAFNTALSEKLDNNLAKDKLITLFFIGIDNFKMINNTLGHAIGDQTLITVSNLITSTFPEGQFFRLSGDEFILIALTKDKMEANEMSDRIHRSTRIPFTIGSNSLHVTFSIGVAFAPENGADVATLLQSSSTALHEAKKKGKNSSVLFSKEMRQEEVLHMQISSALNSSVLDEEFALVFQPVVEASTGKLVGAEALLRWTSKQIGNVRPDIFIPVAEQNGKITDIGNWVMEEACRIRASWTSLGLHELKLSINISPAQMLSCDVPDLVENALTKHNLPASAIAVEITENVFLGDRNDLNNQLERLKTLGVSMYLDDFGTGYSSLSYVSKYPFDIIKMDKSFIQDIEENPISRTLAIAIMSMATNLGLEVIAEGVETKWQNEFLTQYGCHRIQGYYYGKPVNSNEFVKKWATKKYNQDTHRKVVDKV